MKIKAPGSADGGFTQIPNGWLWCDAVRPEDVIVYGRLRALTGGKSKESGHIDGLTELSDMLGMKNRTLGRVLTRMERAGMIKRSGTTELKSVVQLLEPPKDSATGYKSRKKAKEDWTKAQECPLEVPPNPHLRKQLLDWWTRIVELAYDGATEISRLNNDGHWDFTLGNFAEALQAPGEARELLEVDRDSVLEGYSPRERTIRLNLAARLESFMDAFDTSQDKEDEWE